MASGNLAACLALTLREEGGYSNDPRDPGGATMKGVTKAVYDAWRRGKGLALRDVRLISDAELQDIYRSGYWTPVGAEALAAGLDLSAFDFAVNSGPARAKKALAQVGNLPTAQAISRVADLRLSFLHGLKTWSAFGKGWGLRVARIEAASLKMAGAPLASAAEAAERKARLSKTRAQAAAVAATPLSVGVVQHGSGPGWLAVVLIALLAAAGVAGFSLWRQRQRAQILADAAAAELAAKAQAAATGVAIKA